MIRIGQKYIDPASVSAIEPQFTDPDNRSVVLIGTNWLHVDAPAAVVVDRIREALDE